MQIRAIWITNRFNAKQLTGTPSETLNEQSYTLYDPKYRPIRTYTTNHLGGYTRIDSKLDFSGKVEFTETYHRLNSSSSSVQYTIKDSYTYTDEDRLLTHIQQINGDAEQLIASNSYDELGRLVSKNVGGTDTTGAIGLQKVDYRYNIRGWLTDINNIRPEGDPMLQMEEEDLFGFKINYNKVTETDQDGISYAPNSVNGQIKRLFNGNIAETFWITNSDNVLRKYGYQYDALNRLNKAIYQKPISGNPVPGSYDETVSYDKNGNITSLKRTGNLDHPTVKIDIDDLSYTYNGNRLMRVNDATNNPEGFKDNGYGNTYNDYTYDANGNMTKDENKKITNIVYNHLNLPTEILFADGNKINYLYNAAGTKVQKLVTENSSTKRVDYQNGFQYLSQKLSFFPHAEGYVQFTSDKLYNYVFNYTDHLGNIRVSWTWDDKNGILAIMEENHYYPFGLKHSAYNTEEYTYTMPMDGSPGYNMPELSIVVPEMPNPYKYKYNGKEFQDELGLNVYNYGARNYDAAIGRWINLDALSEEYSDYSPYVYAFNDPVRHIDPDGNAPEDRLGETDPPGKKKSSSLSSSNIKSIPIQQYQGGYVGQGLDELVTAGIQWLGSKISSSDVSKSTSENFQLATSLAIVIVSKGKNAKADEQVVEQLTKTEANAVGKSTKTGSGRGTNNRTADPDAVGDHTVVNENGSTTYKVNQNNPNKNNKGIGFETSKRVDYKGAAHVDKKTGVKTPTPHVQEKGAVRPAIPGVDMPKK